MSKRKYAKADLNERQRLFALEYPVDFNATEAAKRAGYSPRTAHVQGHDLLRHPKIKPEIEKATAALAKRTETGHDWVIEQLKLTARIGQEATPPQVAGVVKALELIGKHLGMFTDRKDISVHASPCLQRTDRSAL